MQLLQYNQESLINYTNKSTEMYNTYIQNLQAKINIDWKENAAKIHRLELRMEALEQQFIPRRSLRLNSNRSRGDQSL